MRAYDDSKDKLIDSKELINEGNIVSLLIYSYNGNTPKLQIQRSSDDGNSKKFRKLGRLSLDELKFIRENIDHLIEKMESFK